MVVQAFVAEKAGPLISFKFPGPTAAEYAAAGGVTITVPGVTSIRSVVSINSHKYGGAGDETAFVLQGIIDDGLLKNQFQFVAYRTVHASGPPATMKEAVGDDLSATTFTAILELGDQQEISV